MDDFESERPRDADLKFVDDLDRGMDGPPEDRGSLPDEPVIIGAPSSADAGMTRLRPLLDLFPPTAPAAPVATPGRTVPRPAAPRSANRRPAIRTVRPPAPTGSVLTYEIFYGLHEPPFSLVPDLRFLYHTSALDRVVQELLTSINRRDAIFVITAEAGTGKTTLCRAVVNLIDRQTFTSFVADPFVRIEDLLKSILTDFGVISRADIAGGRLVEATRTELAFTLHEFLLSLVQLKGFAVVFIDDAHILSPDMLEEVRAIADTDQPLMEIVLVGEQGPLTKVGRPKGARDGQPVSPRLRLDPLAEDEVGGDLAHRLSVAGGGQARIEFDDDAVERIYDVSRGVPRLVNLIGDRALAVGFEDSASVIDAPLVELSVRDLDLVPPETASARVPYKVLAGAALVGLAVVGAAAGAFVFRHQAARLAQTWIAPPPPPPRRGSFTRCPLSRRPRAISRCFPPGRADPRVSRH